MPQVVFWPPSFSLFQLATLHPSISSSPRSAKHFRRPLSWIQAEVLQKYEGHITIVPRLSVNVLHKVLANPSPTELEWFAREGEKSVWPYLAIIRSHLRIELALHRATRVMREKMSTPRASPVLPELPLDSSTTSLPTTRREFEPRGSGLTPLEMTRRATTSVGNSPSTLSRQGSLNASLNASLDAQALPGYFSPSLFQVRPSHDGAPISPDSIPPRHRSPPPVSPPLNVRRPFKGEDTSPPGRKARSGSLGSLGSVGSAGTPAFRKPAPEPPAEDNGSPPAEPEVRTYSRRLSSAEARGSKTGDGLGAFMALHGVVSPTAALLESGHHR